MKDFCRYMVVLGGISVFVVGLSCGKSNPNDKRGIGLWCGWGVYCHHPIQGAEGERHPFHGSVSSIFLGGMPHLPILIFKR